MMWFWRSATKTLPPDCPHETDFGPARHVEVHNVYGMQMARASREGALRFDPAARPFVITRAGYGEQVWNREPRTLTTLEKARAAVRAGTFTRAASR